MNTLEAAVAGIKKRLKKIRGVFAVILYGSVARGDYSIRHSDIDILVILEETKARVAVERAINELNITFRVKIHPEYQSRKTEQEDHTLLWKMFEEGRVLFSKGIWFIDSGKLGLDAFRLYRFDTKGADKVKKVILSRALHGRNSEYKGLIDGVSIIDSGRGGLLVRKDRFRDIEELFKRFNVAFKIKKTIYG